MVSEFDQHDEALRAAGKGASLWLAHLKVHLRQLCIPGVVDHYCGLRSDVLGRLYSREVGVPVLAYTLCCGDLRVGSKHM
eukprot:scaffold889_cov268-Pinguiococcus_pyrenoidosus.AAC.16